ncbi:otu domain-containing protein 6b-like protein [Dermatophagoides farinae]|uniref:ubiquitinyl hydrolase 1 n=1 Tax=Dermatophagoides farinae TaxID=6954 RepID=A0A9D4P1Q6_DERFA|nr:otu domain-containing protein 6b-like protein [Dermatophagoides farinae]
MSMPDLPEEIIERQRQEKKDLNAKVTKLRFSVPKNDKKKKKEINSQIELMEAELKAKHEQEIFDWQQQQLHQQQQQQQNSLQQKTLLESSQNDKSDNDYDYEENNRSMENLNKPKITKSQRRRENKERKDRERQERIKAGLLDDIDSTRSIEMKKIESLLEERNLSLCEIPSDGDCMYKAIEHQLRLTRNIDQTVDELRYQASEYIRQNKDDFIPFLLNDENSVVTDKEFEVYCDKIANTKTWGGHLELKALSNTLKVPIEIIQAEGTPIQIGFSEFGSKNPLILCYFRHAYRLGEHYNSVMPNGEVPDDEEWHNTE